MIRLNGMAERVPRLPWYPLAFVVTLVLTLYVARDVSLFTLFRPMIVVLGVATVALLAALRLFKSADRAGIVVGSLLLLALVNSLERMVLAGLLMAFVATVSLLLARLAKRRLDARRLTGVANTFSLILLAVVVASGVLNGTWVRAVGELQPSASAAAPAPSSPSIYVILLDGYPRADSLQRLFGFDNSHFLRNLEARGFDVSDRSSANYMHTSLTLPSMFQVAHVDPLNPFTRKDLNHNPVFDHLRQHGYRIATVAVPWEHVAIDKVDEVCGSGKVTEFEMHLMRSTLLLDAVRSINPSFSADRQRSYVTGAFDCLRGFATSSGEPQFVFAHIGSPHWPIVFRKDGAAASLAMFTEQQERPPITPAREAAYVEQVGYINAQVLEAVDVIRTADSAAVVLVLSDHGSEFHLDPRSIDRTDLDERLSNLFAAYTPGRDCLYGEANTTVNTFSTLLNAYFGRAIPSQPNYLYASPVTNPYHLTRVDHPDMDAAC